MILGSDSPSLTFAHALPAMALAFYVLWWLNPLRTLWLFALLAHGAALTLELLPPGLMHGAGQLRFGFAPALSIIAWFSLLVYAFETRLQVASVPRHILALWGLLSVLLALLFPGSVLPGVQANRFAAHLHWLFGLAAYGLFAVAVLHAVMMQAAEARLRRHQFGDSGEGWPLLKMERLTFRFLSAGFALLTLSLALGFALPFHWGDEKILLALAGWLVFAALLVARHTFGVRGRLAVRVIYAGAALLLFAYIGTRLFKEFAP